jgi:hypothetical protein
MARAYHCFTKISEDLVANLKRDGVFEFDASVFLSQVMRI